MNFENLEKSKMNDEDKKLSQEELYEKFPGVGGHDVTEADSEGKYDLVGRGITSDLKAGEVEHRRLSKKFRKDREQNSLDKLSKEERKEILKQAEEFAHNSKDLIGLSPEEWNTEFSKIMQEKAEELALDKLKEKE